MLAVLNLPPPAASRLFFSPVCLPRVAGPGPPVDRPMGPTASTRALFPEEAQKRLQVRSGFFEVCSFAAEPDVVNPVAMTWDERGRLWVLELYEFPLGAP